MAIDDPIGVELRQLQEQIDEDSYMPDLVAKVGFSAATAAALSAHPFISQVFTSLLAVSPRRFERRFLSVMVALANQQKQIEGKISDNAYYQSEEFHALLTLVLERLHSTYQEEKLKTFGEALANSGTTEFAKDDKEPYIRTLRDLSLQDLKALREMKEISLKRNPYGYCDGSVPKSDNASLARLASLGLIRERTELKEFNLRAAMPRSSQTAEMYAREVVEEFRDYFKKAPSTSYRISGFGHRFLSFIASAAPQDPPT